MIRKRSRLLAAEERQDAVLALGEALRFSSASICSPFRFPQLDDFVAGDEFFSRELFDRGDRSG
jgi:hypothetical protein